MPEPEPEIHQPLEMKVNPQAWTTRVNVAVIVAVAIVLVIGAIYAVYAIMNTSKVQDDMHDDVTLPQPGP